MSEIQSKKITVIGLGYIGLPTAAIFAKFGQNVVGYDLNEKVIEALNKGEILIEEPGLKELVSEVVEDGRLRGVSQLEESDVFIICVPTPVNEDKTANMSYVASAAEEVSRVLKKGNVVVLESTSPPGATDGLMASILGKSGLKIGEDVFVAHSPERVLPGRIIQELIENDRIIGGINQDSAEIVKEIYEIFVQGEIFTTDSKTAEMTKLMENTFRDVNIALANELAILSENIGINAWDVIKFANKHPRVNIHQPGPGVGGHCIAVDPWFVIEGQPDGKLIKMSRNINDGMPIITMNRIKELADDQNGKIAILGLTYKPNVDDTRESPIIKLVELLKANTNYVIALHDPYVHKDSFKFKDLMEDSVYETLNGADLMVLAVNHDKYKELDFERISSIMNKKKVYDTRSFLNREELKKQGFEVALLGRR